VATFNSYFTRKMTETMYRLTGCALNFVWYFQRDWKSTFHKMARYSNST